MLLHRPTRFGRARIRRRSAKLHKPLGKQSIRRLDSIPITVDVRVFVANTAPLPHPSAVPALGQVAFADPQRKKHEKLDRAFREHAERWKRDTRHWSSMTKMIMHPSYRRIMGMGPDVLPLILRELRQSPDHWLIALNAISGEDPAPPNSTFNQAVDAWLAWGVQKGYLQ
jgi:hypothetical protein